MYQDLTHKHMQQRYADELPTHRTCSAFSQDAVTVLLPLLASATQAELT